LFDIRFDNRQFDIRFDHPSVRDAFLESRETQKRDCRVLGLLVSVLPCLPEFLSRLVFCKAVFLPSSNFFFFRPSCDLTFSNHQFRVLSWYVIHQYFSFAWSLSFSSFCSSRFSSFTLLYDSFEFAFESDSFRHPFSDSLTHRKFTHTSTWNRFRFRWFLFVLILLLIHLLILLLILILLLFVVLFVLPSFSSSYLNIELFFSSYLHSIFLAFDFGFEFIFSSHFHFEFSSSSSSFDGF